MARKVKYFMQKILTTIQSTSSFPWSNAIIADHKEHFWIYCQWILIFFYSFDNAEEEKCRFWMRNARFETQKSNTGIDMDYFYYLFQETWLWNCKYATVFHYCFNVVLKILEEEKSRSTKLSVECRELFQKKGQHNITDQARVHPGQRHWLSVAVLLWCLRTVQQRSCDEEPCELHLLVS